MVTSAFVDKPPQRHRWTVVEYHKMVDTKLLTENSRVELIDGEIIEMPPIGSPHAGKVNRLIRLFSPLLGKKAIVSVQNPLVLSDYDEPQPDLTVLRWRDDFYENAHPRPEDVLLLIEVSDTTVRYDREVKISLYARCGVPEAWLINLQMPCLEVYCAPQEGKYRRIERYRTGNISPERLPEVTIDIAALFH